MNFVKQGAMSLAHHLGKHVEATAMGHAQHDLLHTEIAAALDDLLECRDQRFRAVETEALGAGIFEIEKFLETLALDQLVEDRLLAARGEFDLLVGPLDAFLQPRLLDRVGDMHELDAERLAIGALKDGEDFADRREFEPQHVVEEDLAVVIGFGETVMRRGELLVIDALLETQRIQIGMQVAAHAVGADHHQRMQRIARGLLHMLLGQRNALGLGPCP